MDDHVISAAFEPHWVRQTGAMPPAARATPRGSLFLRRDLSDEALRQPPEPLFTQADLAAVRQEGFDAGHAAGMAAAAASRAAARTASEIQALGTIAALMAGARKESARVADLAADALARTVIAAMDAVMPDLIRRSALNEVGAMLALVLPGLSREPAVRVEVPPEIADAIAATLASLPPEQRDTVTVTGLAPMRPGEARVHWAAGHARRQPAQVWESVMQALHPALGHPELDQPELKHPEPEHAKLDHPKLDHAEMGFPKAKDGNNGD
jgi:flagellar biosynthesis/type III secretory pathway protein FliH